MANNNNSIPSNSDNERNLLEKILRRFNSNVGANGGEEFSDTEAHNGDWTQLYAVEDSILSAITSNITNLSQDTPIAAGDRLYALISSFTLASGKVIAYN